jgi:GxxExxY protein
LGPGLLESIYEECLTYELKDRMMHIQRQVELPISYKSKQLDNRLRIDLLVENQVIIELKSVEKLLPIHQAQLMTYLKLSKKELGLLINFNEKLLKNGFKRIRM